MISSRLFLIWFCFLICSSVRVIKLFGDSAMYVSVFFPADLLINPFFLKDSITTYAELLFTPAFFDISLTPAFSSSSRARYIFASFSLRPNSMRVFSGMCLWATTVNSNFVPFVKCVVSVEQQFIEIKRSALVEECKRYLTVIVIGCICRC